jgi:hypothetical protein
MACLRPIQVPTSRASSSSFPSFLGSPKSKNRSASRFSKTNSFRMRPKIDENRELLAVWSFQLPRCNRIPNLRQADRAPDTATDSSNHTAFCICGRTNNLSFLVTAAAGYRESSLVPPGRSLARDSSEAASASIGTEDAVPASKTPLSMGSLRVTLLLLPGRLLLQ